MQSATKILLTAGLGAATMYYLDPVQGRKRRDITRRRLEHGRDALQDVSRTARAVGHDVGRGTDRAIHGVRAIGHKLGDRAGRVLHRARSAGEDVGHGIGHDIRERAGRLTHGLREAGHEARERAASSLGSLYERGRSSVSSGSHASGRSALKLVGIPVKWLFIAGIGASAMYFLDPSQGLYRRARFRNRFLQNRHKAMNGAGTAEDEHAAQATASSGDGSSLRDEERPLPG